MLSPDKLHDRLSGEVLPGPAAFIHTELASGNEESFRRNELGHGPLDIARWRMRYNNTGLYRSVQWSNEPDFLTKYSDPNTLFYGDLCFDFDVDKEDAARNWSVMIDEVLLKFLPVVYNDFDIPAEAIRIWFSGSRGLHIEVPAAAIGIWPHHELHRIFGFYAKDLKAQHGLQFLDMSLYGGKHLYRLEDSIHQRSGLYKWPLKTTELGAAKDLEFLCRQATRRRDSSKIWTPIADSTERGRHRWTQLVAGAFQIKRIGTTIDITAGDIRHYRRGRYLCISTLFSDGYLLSHGNRNTTAFMLAAHLRQNGFDREQAHEELRIWATDHCDPPFTAEADIAEWERALTRVYDTEELPTTGCTFIQNTLPHLCQESACTVGQARIARRQSKSPV